MAQPFKRRVLSKNALVITLSGEKAGAAQIFNYDLIREVRMDLENLEVQVLMTYDDAYIRVFDVDKSKVDEKDMPKYREAVLKFYNDLITASMKLSAEEIEAMKKQAEDIKKKLEAAQAKAQPAAKKPAAKKPAAKKETKK